MRATAAGHGQLRYDQGEIRPDLALTEGFNYEAK